MCAIDTVADDEDEDEDDADDDDDRRAEAAIGGQRAAAGRSPPPAPEGAEGKDVPTATRWPPGAPKKVWGMLNVGIMKYWMGDWTNLASVCY